MLRQTIYLVIFSVLTIVFIREVGYVLQFVDHFHNVVAREMAVLFSGGTIGRIIRETIALILIPGVIGGIAYGVYWLITRKGLSYITHIVWISWIVLATSVVLHH